MILPVIDLRRALSCPTVTYMTSTSTPVAPVFTHTPACDVNAIGHVTRNARDTAATLPPEQVDALGLLDFLAEEARRVQTTGDGFTCDCGRLALGRAEDRLRIARKQLRTIARSVTAADWIHRDSLVDRIDALVAERDAIRDAL